MRTLSDFLGNSDYLLTDLPELRGVAIDRAMWALTPYGYLMKATPRGGLIIAVFHPEDPDEAVINVVYDGSPFSKSGPPHGFPCLTLERAPGLRGS